VSEDIATLLSASSLPSVEGGKGSRGNLVIVGGSPSCPGSAILAGRAALRCGAGRVQLVVHPEVAPAVGAAFPEALVLAWDHESPPAEDVRTQLHDGAAVIVGPGLDERAPVTAVTVGRHLGEGLLVVDARALPALTDPALERVPRLAAPNPHEACRLLSEADGAEETEPTRRDLSRLAGAMAELVGGPAAVRGETTVLDDGAGQQWEESSTAPGLGTPGSGDVLMGALGAFLVRGATPLIALGWAIAAHAGAGSILAAAHPVGFLAGEVADTLPAAVAALQGGRQPGPSALDQVRQ
jgi:hydroxyethylthiazole kinase-like uncharacterized protein yjeF